MKTVHEVSKLSGVSIRTLHYYDEIGLLRPSKVTEAGYRLYDTAELERLQTILFFRELDFSLKDIAHILNSSVFDRRKVLKEQMQLLLMKQNRFHAMIECIQTILEKGEDFVNFKAFDSSELDAFKKEAKQRWGDTDAYLESEEKSAKRTKQEQASADDRLMQQFAGFASLREHPVQSEAVQQQVESLRQTITDLYYNCTPPILQSLGEMYVADERFTANIDQYGKGTAEFVNRAIQYYCRSHTNPD